jgi:hypothetical protein
MANGDTHGDGQPPSLSPMEILNAARKAVPAVDYALGVAGVAAAGAIVIALIGRGQAAAIILGAVFVAMLLLFAFSRLVAAQNRSIVNAGIFLLWASITFFVVFLIFTTTAVAIQWPIPWARVLGVYETDSFPVKSTTIKSYNGAVTETGEQIDWSNAKPLSISNNVPIADSHGGANVPWSVIYDISGKYKDDDLHNIVYFKIDKLTVSANPGKARWTSQHLNLLQVGICRDYQGAFDISPSGPGSANSAKISIDVILGKDKSLNGLPILMAANNKNFNFEDSWPCTLLYNFAGGSYPAHQLFHQRL